MSVKPEKLGTDGYAKPANGITLKEVTAPTAVTQFPEAIVWRITTGQIALRLFLTCWLIYVLHFATNTVREIYPALSLGDHLSFDVHEYLGLHSDIFELPGRGVFINNNPGASILGAVPYILTRPATDFIVNRVAQLRADSGADAPEYDSIYPLAREFYRKAWERGLDIKFGLAAGVMQALLMAPLSALSAVVIFYILFSLTGSVPKALWLSLLYAFATPIFYRTAQLNHNLLEAHFALFAFALVWRPWDYSERPRLFLYLLAGLFTGWTVVLDYSGLVFVLVMGLYVLIRHFSLPVAARSWTSLILFASGVGISGGILMGYQWYNFGHPFYPAQHYMPETKFSHRGYQGMDLPQLDLIWELAFGLRYGLFTSAPFLLLALFVPGWYRRRTRLVGDREMWFIVAFTIVFFLFTAANQFARMQFNTGVRHIVPVVPFLFLLAATVFLRLPALPAALFGVITTYWSWCLAMYRDVELGWGIPESLIHVTFEGFRLPWLTTLEKMGYFPNGTSTIPILLLSGVVVAALWYVKEPGMENGDST